MKPVSPVIPALPTLSEFVYAAGSPEQIPLPTWRSASSEGMVVSRWRLTWKERLQVLFSGNLWMAVLTYRKPLQPSKLYTSPPIQDMESCGSKIEPNDGGSYL